MGSVNNQTINKINKIIETNIDEGLAICKDSQMMGSKQKHCLFNKGHVKIAIYTILATLATVSLSGEGRQIVITGIKMIINGECGYLSNRLWFQHPMCTYWNYIINSVGKAIVGDSMAITQLSGATIALVNTPRTIDAIVDSIAETISRNNPELITREEI